RRRDGPAARKRLITPARPQIHTTRKHMPHQLLAGKRGVIFGALDESSIATHVARHCVAEGARITLTNAPVAMRFGSIQKLGEELNAPVFPADATSTDELKSLFEQSREALGGPFDF